MVSNSPVRLGVADRSPIFASAVIDLATRAFEADGLDGEAIDAEDLDRLRAPSWDVLLIDPLFTPTLMTLVPQMLSARPGMALIAVASLPTRELVDVCLDAGFRSVVSKSVSGSALMRVIRVAMAGGSFVERSVGRAATAPQAGPTEGKILTPREEDILKLWARGYSNSDIAGRIGLSPKTVDTHRARGMAKLGLADRPALIRMASARGWLN